jgi:acyl-coenzyme A thioesterase PaaI-like protein
MTGWQPANPDYESAVRAAVVTMGEEIVARGRVVKPGNLITIAAADVYAISGAAKAETLCAVAPLTFRNVNVRVPD